MKKILVLLVSIGMASSLYAQELNCTVQILAPTISGTTEKKVLETLKQDIFQFVNNRKWTTDQFKQEERIECSFIIDISEKLSESTYKGSIQVQLNRPIFNSAYKSLVFNYRDNDFSFSYVEFQPLEFNESTNTSNLTSALAYYVYLLIGMDYDTYSLEGGTPFYQKCQTVVGNCQNSSEKGWKAFEGNKNRYWLVENILAPTYKPLRECNYKYHRLGFDVMAKDVSGGRQVIFDAVQLLKKIYDEKPGSFNLQSFFVSKFEEIISLFGNTAVVPEEKTKLVNLVTEIDASHANQYQKILQNN